jgi:hypothetical protein
MWYRCPGIRVVAPFTDALGHAGNKSAPSPSISRGLTAFHRSGVRRGLEFSVKNLCLYSERCGLQKKVRCKEAKPL